MKMLAFTTPTAWGLFALGAVMPVAFISGVTGYSLEPNFYVLLIGVPILLFGVRIRPTPAHWIGLALVVLSALSALWAPYPAFAGETAMRLAPAVLAFMLGAEVEERPVFYGLAAGMIVNTIIAFYQWSQGQLIIAGLLFNTNAMTEPAALVALWFALGGSMLGAILVPAIVLPGTRAGILVLGVGLGYWLWQRSKMAAIAIILILIYVGWGSRPSSTNERVAVWKDTYAGLSVMGHGLGSFSPLFPRYATNLESKFRPFHAHSDILEVTFELGVLGLILFLALLAAIWHQAAPNRRPFLAACFVLLALDFPLFLPTTGFIIAFMAGRAASDWHEPHIQWVVSRYRFYASAAHRRLLRHDPSKRKVPV